MHPIHRVTGFQFAGAYTLRVEFDDGACQIVDLEPVLAGELYGPLRDERLFRQVCIDPEVHTLVWPNGADFDPAILHDWPKRAEAMENLALNWVATSQRADASPSHSVSEGL